MPLMRREGGRHHLQAVGAANKTRESIPLAADRKLWEQQPKESESVYRYFREYFLTPIGQRGCNAIATKFSKHPGYMNQLCARWSWVERAAEWDREQTHVKILAARDEAVEMGKRQAQHAQVAQQALLAPAMALLQKLRNDPDFINRCLHIPLDASGTRPANAREAIDQISKLMTVIQKCAAVMPLVANYERAARGLLNESYAAQQQQDDSDQPRDDASAKLTRAVLSDPEIAGMANALYSKLAS